MKKLNPIAFVLSMLLCLIVAGCSTGNTSSMISDILPKSITRIEVGGSYNGELEPWELTSVEIEELRTWVSQLSLTHRTYAKGEAPNEVYNGGICYTFDINDGETSFTWVYIDKPYIHYDGEWYEITNTKNPPLDLAGPGKPGK